MQEDPLKRSSVKNITKTLVAFKAARLSLGLNRRQAAEDRKSTRLNSSHRL